MSVSEFTLPNGLAPRPFLEGMRNRVLRVTTGMRPGPQRLELAIEAFWYAALDAASSAQPRIPWSSFASGTHPLRGLIDPLRLMIRSELMNSGLAAPDALTAQALDQILQVAEAEAASGKAMPENRELFCHWLERQVSSRGGTEGVAATVNQAA